MRKLQQGFTLIELMIVVAIIGILAAIAIPAYQDYTQRAQMGEAFTIAAAAKTSLEEYAQTNGVYPPRADIDALKIEMPGPDAAKYVESVVVGDDTGVITVTMQDVGVGPDIITQTVTLTPVDLATLAANGGAFTWTCVSSAKQKYLPKTCTGT
jgi:type IV pilus assembly protein PilA